jgi:mannose-6-phosphate isomerase-like protein (cupin superfamily)
MRITFMWLAAPCLLLGCKGGADRTADREPGAAANQPQTDTMASASTATADTASDSGLTWGPAPPGLPAGARAAVVSGDPTKAGPFTVRLDMPPDYAIRPHYHPTSEELRVLEGTVHVGHGGKWDEQAMKAVAKDKPITIGAKEPHFLHAASRAVVEVQSTGPFAITYVNPKDDPRTKSTP